MKHYIKIISLLLSLCMILSSVSLLASCDDQTVSEGTTNTAESESESKKDDIHPEIEKKNYDEEFYLHILPDVNPVGYYWVQESKNDIMSDAIYARQEKVRQHIGVEIIGTGTGNFSQYIEPFKTAVKNKDGSVDTLISHVYTGIDGLIGENYLTDFNDMPGVELDADYWNQRFMEDIALNDHMYLGFSDFNILYTHVITFNKDILDKYDDALDESLYDSVTNYRWTLDKMISLASLAYIDNGNDGKTVNDQFGITGYQNIGFAAFLQSSNINLVEQTVKGDYEVAVYNDVNREKTAALVDKIKGMVNADYSWFWNDGTPTVPMTSNRTLFCITHTYSLPGYIEYDVNFGVLPYPMWDEAQKNVGYRSLQWGGYICIPSYLGNAEMVGETIELLSFYSGDVTDVFYQKLLGKQVADSPQDKQMLDIVWDSVCSDFGQTYFSVVDDTNLLYLVTVLTRPNTTENLASFMAKVDRTSNKLFKQFLKKTK